MSHNARHGKSVAIVQARLGSSRLPLKSLLCLRDLPVIDWVTRRLAQSRRLDRIMVAVPDTELDRVLLEHLRRRGVPCLAGPESDVLARFCLAARAAEADLVVRVCADNPLIWGEAVDRLLAHYERTDCDYATTFRATTSGPTAWGLKFSPVNCWMTWMPGQSSPPSASIA